MKIRKFACALFSLAFLFSCSEESLPETEPILNMQKISDRIGMEDAMILVEEARVLLDKESPSESRYSRAVNSVSALFFGDVKASAMKSGKYKELGISDTLAYVFNFGDSSGFVIVSKDKRVEAPLFAFAEKGSLFNGETDNPGLALFLERLESYVLESIAKSGKGEEKKEIMAVAQKGPVDPAPLAIIVGPLVPVEWGQREPFWNNLKAPECFNIYNGILLNDGHYKTGCTATAIAQIMSYWKYPTIIEGIYYDWTLLNKRKHSGDFYSPNDFYNANARAMVADLFQQISEGVKTSYGCDESTATLGNAYNFLVSIGFTNSVYFINYNLNFVGAALMERVPLMGRGCNNKNCHIWVIDGVGFAISESYFYYYIHNNWGWNGDDNGYYLSGVFDPTSMPTFQNVLVTDINK